MNSYQKERALSIEERSAQIDCGERLNEIAYNLGKSGSGDVQRTIKELDEKKQAMAYFATYPGETIAEAFYLGTLER